MSTNALTDDGLDIGIDTWIRNEPGYRVRLAVEAFKGHQSMEMVLRTPPKMVWWKSLSYFPYMMGTWAHGPESRIETKDNVHEAALILDGPALTSMGQFQLWKGGILGFGAFAGQLPINSWANQGRRLIFTWVED